MIKKDRRAAARYMATPSTYVSYIEGSGQIRDLSVDGVFVIDSEPLPMETKIMFSLFLGSQTISIEGIVRRSVENEGMAIQFMRMSPESKRRLRIHLASLVPAPEIPAKF